MVKSNRYSPTNKKFKSHFENFASEKVKKGHLNNKEDRDAEDTTLKNGVLKKIDRDKIYDKGWYVEIDKATKQCSYSNNVVSIPPCTESGRFLVPKKKCEVEVQLDKKSKIYSITRIKDVNLTPIALYEDSLTISTNTNTKTNKDNTAKIKVNKTSIQLEGDVSTNSLNVNQNIEVEGDVTSSKVTTDKIEADNIDTELVNTKTVETKDVKSTGTANLTNIQAISIEVEEDVKSSNIKMLEDKVAELEEKIKSLEKNKEEQEEGEDE